MAIAGCTRQTRILHTFARAAAFATALRKGCALHSSFACLAPALLGIECPTLAAAEAFSSLPCVCVPSQRSSSVAAAAAASARGLIHLQIFSKISACPSIQGHASEHLHFSSKPAMTMHALPSHHSHHSQPPNSPSRYTSMYAVAPCTPGGICCVAAESLQEAG